MFVFVCFTLTRLLYPPHLFWSCRDSERNTLPRKRVSIYVRYWTWSVLSSSHWKWTNMNPFWNVAETPFLRPRLATYKTLTTVFRARSLQATHHASNAAQPKVPWCYSIVFVVFFWIFYHQFLFLKKTLNFIGNCIFFVFDSQMKLRIFFCFEVLLRNSTLKIGRYQSPDQITFFIIFVCLHWSLTRSPRAACGFWPICFPCEWVCVCMLSSHSSSHVHMFFDGFFLFAIFFGYASQWKTKQTKTTLNTDANSLCCMRIASDWG